MKKPKRNQARYLQGHSLHPLSLLFECLSIVRSNLLPFAIAGVTATQGGEIGFSLAVAFGLLAIATASMRFITFRYRVVDDQLIIDQGLIFHQHRSIPIDRIQNIDLLQNPLHRLFSVGEVRVETASGNEPEAVMRVLALADLTLLRSTVFERQQAKIAAGSVDESSSVPQTETQVVDAPQIDTLPSQLIYKPSMFILMLAGFLSNRGIVLAGIGLGFIWQIMGRNQSIVSPSRWKNWNMKNTEGTTVIHDITNWLILSFESTSAWLMLMGAALLGFLILKIVSAIWYLLRFYGYQLNLTGDDLRVRCGLLTKVSATIPRRRIQVISIHRPGLSRLAKLASIRIETAGGGSEDEDAAKTVGRRWFLPAVQERDLPRILHFLQPDIEFNPQALTWYTVSPRAFTRLLRCGMFFSLAAVIIGAIVQPYWGWSVGIALLAISYCSASLRTRCTRYAITDWGFVYQSGLWYRKLSMTFFDRIQGIVLDQSPFDRRWRMATLKIDTTGAGPAEHAFAIKLLDEHCAQDQFVAIRSHMALQ